MTRPRINLQKLALQKLAAMERQLARLDKERERVGAERAALIEQLDPKDPDVQRWADGEVAGERASDGLFAFEPLEPPCTPGVYAIQGDGPFVKIGRASNIRQRLGDLQIGRAQPLGLLAVLSHDPKKEHAFHHELRAWRVRGEWFRLEGEVLTMLQAYRGAQ